LIGLDRTWVWLSYSVSADHDVCVAVEPDWHSPIAPGASLYLLPQPFQPYLAFTILDVSKTWRKSEFKSHVAASSHVIGTDGKSWRKLRPIESETELKQNETLVMEGWDHEHCDLCNKHIYPEVSYFIYEDDEARYFLCEFCHERFAVPHAIDLVIYPGHGPREGEPD